MGAVDTAEPKQHKKGKKHKKKGRVAIRIDMTPMVDVAFLLLTFFMLTTVFSKPQTMEINLPPDQETKIDVAESNLMTILVDADGNLFWNMGVEPPKAMTFKELRPLLLARNKENPKLVTLLKVDRDGKYTMMVDLMDELNLANIQRFTLAPMLPTDKDLIKKAKAS